MDLRLKMTDCLLIGPISGKSSLRTLPSIPVVSALLTETAQQFLSAIAPRAYREAIALAVQLKVTVVVSFSRAISDGLTVQTIFSIMTHTKHWKGQTLSLNSPDSRLSEFTICETTQQHVKISAHLLDQLAQLSGKPKHEHLLSTYPVLTSQKIIHAEALALHGLSLEQYRESRLAA